MPGSVKSHGPVVPTKVFFIKDYHRNKNLKVLWHSTPFPSRQFLVRMNGGDGSSRAHFADSPGAFQKTSRHFEINWDHWQRYARIDNTANWREVERVMRHQASNKKKLDYPDATDGTRWAAKARKLASKLTPEQEADHFRQAMAKIYGVHPKETIGAGL